jgi:hypothetical protein
MAGRGPEEKVDDVTHSFLTDVAIRKGGVTS